MPGDPDACPAPYPVGPASAAPALAALAVAAALCAYAVGPAAWVWLGMLLAYGGVGLAYPWAAVDGRGAGRAAIGGRGGRDAGAAGLVVGAAGRGRRRC